MMRSSLELLYFYHAGHHFPCGVVNRGVNGFTDHYLIPTIFSQSLDNTCLGNNKMSFISRRAFSDFYHSKSNSSLWSQET